jgi:hypothetical protein
MRIKRKIRIAVITTISAYDRFVDTVSMLELCEMLRRFKRYPRTIGVNYEK